MRSISGVLAAALAASCVSALPADIPPATEAELAERGLKYCSPLDLVFNVLRAPKLKAKASSFCSDFIKTTSTAFVTHTATQTDTVVFAFTTPATTVTNTNLITSRATVTNTAYLPNPTVSLATTTTSFTRIHNFKRAVPIPTEFPFLANQLSSACSCIVSAPTVVVSSSTTVTQTAAVTQSTTVAGGPPAQTTVDDTVFVTEKATVTLPPTSTQTVYTSTSVVVQPSSICGQSLRLSRNDAPTLANEGILSASECVQRCQSKAECKCVVLATSGICVTFRDYCENVEGPQDIRVLRYWDKDCPIPS